MKNIIFVVLSLMLFGCVGEGNKPRHWVYEGKGPMIVEHIKILKSETDYGLYEYYITDATNTGWGLRSNIKYQIGDTVRIVTTKK